MRKIFLENILPIIKGEYTIQGSDLKKYINTANSIDEAHEKSIIWLDPLRKDKEQIVRYTKAGMIVCDNSLNLTEENSYDKILIQVKNPKLTYIQILNTLFLEKPIYGIHPSAIIHPEAQIDKNVFIGPLTYIGKSIIKEGTIIHGNVHIKDNVKIGRNVFIQSGCIIGGTGLNFLKDEEGNFHDFPHLAGVTIEDDVEIQAMNVIDRGVLSDTVIGRKTKIDSFCYIAHNCKIGEENMIIGKVLICGSVTTGKNCWFGPSSVVRDCLNIGHRAYVGMGSLVVSDLEDDAKVMGNPARPISDMKKILNTFKTFLQDEK